MTDLRRRGEGMGWAEEELMVLLTGGGTRSWSAAEKSELLTTGRVAGDTPHHINSVAWSPWLAGNARKVRIVTPGARLGAHAVRRDDPRHDSSDVRSADQSFSAHQRRFALTENPMARNNDGQRLSVGAWVESFSPGVWQVVHVLEGFFELRFHPEEPKRVSRRRLVFSKRLVDDKWRKAFKAEMAEAAVVHPLGDDQHVRLVEYTGANPKVLAEFEAFRPEMPDHIASLRLNVPQPAEIDGLRSAVGRALAGIEDGLTNDEVLDRLARSPLAGHLSAGLSNVTVRFLCRRHEVRDGQFVFRAVDVQPF
jgi:hypothetical protein